MLIVLACLVFLIIFYLYNVRTFDYWKKRDVKHDKPILFFGTNASNFLMQKSRAQVAEGMYWKYPSEKVIGFFRSTTPELIIRDPAIVKKILITDYLSFHARGFHPYKNKMELLMRYSLFFTEGDLWKILRLQMTPTFTSGKLKGMFPLIVERTGYLQQIALKGAKNNCTMDARELMSRYTTDCIGSCGFGIDSNSLQREDCEFRDLGKRIVNPPLYAIVIAILKTIFPAPFKNLEFFGYFVKESRQLIDKILALRNFQPIGRNDFVDHLLEFQKKGDIYIDSIEKFQFDGKPEKITGKLTTDMIYSQINLFFAAGFETSSTAASITLHELSFNPEIQKKVQREIDEVLQKYNNKLSYEAIMEMKYLEWTIKEAMRIFPPVGYIMRECTRKYTFKDLNITIDKGVKITIPIHGALHMDPKYWENPEEFRPERFSSEEFTSVQKQVYLPFGDGPRNCVGARLGSLQTLAGVAAILSKFTVEPAPETVRRPIIDTTSDLVQSIRGGAPLIFRERQL